MIDAVHEPLADLSPAQRQVVVALKRRGEASAEELAEALGITPSGVRQHLAALRAAGVVAARQERGRPGRPTDLYHSTDLAEAVLPTASVDLSVELLGHIEDEDPQLVSRVFERRRDRRVAQARTQLAGKNLDEKMAFLAGMLDEGGYLADFEKLPGGAYRMTLHSCAIWAVASRYGQACTTELEFLREVLPDVEIERVAHKAAGAYACGYEIRPRVAAPRRCASAAPATRSDALEPAGDVPAFSSDSYELLKSPGTRREGHLYCPTALHGGRPAPHYPVADGDDTSPTQPKTQPTGARR